MIAGLPWILWVILAVAGFALFRSFYLMHMGTRPVGDAQKRVARQAWLHSQTFHDTRIGN